MRGLSHFQAEKARSSKKKNRPYRATSRLYEMAKLKLEQAQKSGDDNPQVGGKGRERKSRGVGWKRRVRRGLGWACVETEGCVCAVCAGGGG